MCAARGGAIVIGAPYASGILVRGAGPGALYRYAPAEPAIIAKAQRVAEVCRRHAVPLAAGGPAVPAWPPQRRLGDPRAGCRRRSAPEPRLDVTRPPDALWAELKAEGLVRAEAPTPRFWLDRPDRLEVYSAAANRPLVHGQSERAPGQPGGVNSFSRRGSARGAWRRAYWTAY